MKNIALALLLTASLQAQAAQIGNLMDGAGYLVWTDGTSGSTLLASAGTVNVSLPGGSHKVALQRVASAPTASPTPTETTVQPTPSPTASPSPTRHGRKGREVVVASFDADTQQNRYEILSSTGESLTGVVNILAGVKDEGQAMTADLDGDGILEMVAAGYRAGAGVVVEFWNGNGELIRSNQGFSTDFSKENYLLTGDLDGVAGNEAILLGRSNDGAYHLMSFDHDGNASEDVQVLDAGYGKIESVVVANGEVAFLARKSTNVVDLTVVKDGQVVTSVVLFGNGYTGDATAFSLDINGDGTKEIAAVCRNSQTESFRLLVLSSGGEILLKRNLFPGKFEPKAFFTAADLDGDGMDEVTAVGRMIGTGSNVIQVIDHAGNQVMARSVLDPSFNGANSSLIADLNGDGKPEIIVAGQDSVSGTAAYQVLAEDGNLLGGGTAFETPAAPALASSDANNDGGADLLIVGEFEDGAYGLEMRSASDGQVEFSTTFSAAPSYVTSGNLM
jgi:hypothetical protein